MKNPWKNIKKNGINGEYYLSEDGEFVKKRDETKENLSLLPEPFCGNINAPIYFLNANPLTPKKLPQYSREYRDLWYSNLTTPHNGKFYYLDDVYKNCHNKGYIWWERCLEPLICDIVARKRMDRKVIKKTLIKKLFVVEIYGYHSKSFIRTFIKKNRLFSVDYSKYLVEKAIEKNKHILIGHGVKNWFDLVPKLKKYNKCYFVKSNEQLYLSETTLEPIVIKRIRNIFKKI